MKTTIRFDNMVEIAYEDFQELRTGINTLAKIDPLPTKIRANEDYVDKERVIRIIYKNSNSWLYRVTDFGREDILRKWLATKNYGRNLEEII